MSPWLQKWPPAQCEDDDDDGDVDDEGPEGYRRGGYHAARAGDRFGDGGRYVAQRKLGWGQFSTVWLAFDTSLAVYVAIKIQKSAKEYTNAALEEIELLSAAAAAPNSPCVVRLLDHFTHRGPNGQHVCIVTELLGDSLLRLIRYNGNRGIGLNRVRRVSRSILLGLHHLHTDLGLIHADLKPENVLLISTIDPMKDPSRSGFPPILERPEGNLSKAGPAQTVYERMLRRHARRAALRLSQRRVSVIGVAEHVRSLEGVDLRCKIVDLGNACRAEKRFLGNIQTREYRAPEIIIGANYSCSIDMWSFACIAFELATGDMLFAPKHCHGVSQDEAHLALMTELIGKPPRKVVLSGSRSKDLFDRHGDLKRVKRMRQRPLKHRLVDQYNFSDHDAHEFAEFLMTLLRFEPDKRATAAECLAHPWMAIEDDDAA